MTYCQNCGTQIPDNAVACPACGTYVQQGVPTQPVYGTQPSNDDTGSIGWGILGFLFPLVGLILFLVWKDDKPKSSKVAGKGALISVILSVVLTVLITILTVALGLGSIAMYY